MTDSLSYSAPGPYLPAHPQYYPSSNVGNAVHIVPPVPRPDMAQRKRPKYTRSKTGCMTCRVKKIKCDETKPNCMRCTHGSRECSWPEGVPTRKKSSARKDSVEDRPSTAGSSGLSESSTPPTREHTPPRRQVDLNLMPLSSRPNSDAFVGLHMESEGRRSLERASSYQSNNSNLLSMIPESQYPSRYDYLNGSNPNPTRGMPAPYRTMSHQGHWSESSMDSYYHGHHGMQDRPMVGHGTPNDHSHNRYQ